MLEQLTKLGTSGYDAAVQRRLRFANTVVIFIVATMFILLIVFSTVLLISGRSPLTVGNLGFVLAIILLSLSPLFHRISDVAAALYVLFTAAALLWLVHSQMGYAQGMHNGYIALGALVPLLVGSQRRILAFSLLALMIAGYVTTEIFHPEVGEAIKDRPINVIRTLKYFSIAAISAIIFLTVRYAFQVAESAETALEAEYDRSETLLRNILPDPIALRLKKRPGAVIADRHEAVTVLFADIVDFTPRATQNPPEQVVDLLNRIFSEFDDLAEKYGLEKIKTVGDAYMVVAGIPDPHKDGPAAMAQFALDLMDKTRELSEELGEPIEVRAGIHTGEAVAGVIGTSKFAYDIWGDTVNTAARMEAFGVPNKIQVTEAVKDALQDRYGFKERGVVDIKGKGEMRLYLLEGLAIST